MLTGRARQVRELEERIMGSIPALVGTNTSQPYACDCAACSPEGRRGVRACRAVIRDELVAALRLDPEGFDLDGFISAMLSDTGLQGAPGATEELLAATQEVVDAATNATWSPMKPPDMPLPTHHGAQFTWTGKVGVAEESDLGRSYCTRVWSDAADVGFRVRSHRTGRDLAFVYHRVVEHDGEVGATVFRDAEGLGIEVHVLND